MKKTSSTALLFAALALSACSSLGGGEYGFSDYSLVRVHRVQVGDGSLSVAPPRPWNRHRPILFEDIRDVEDWTLNGPLLDGMSFVTGLRNGKTLIRQRRTASQQVPMFRSNMTPPEIAAMIESLYRVRGGAVDFRTLSLQPRPFLGANGFQLDYEHLDDDELWRRGRAVGAVIHGELYLILLDAAKAHYYDATLPDFEAVVASARLRA
ncbi:MAG: hypothetical protein QOK41_879 [Sphingomonadales bacterium]|nr:hypothetical protein [Sphingomonadales bacterium]